MNPKSSLSSSRRVALRQFTASATCRGRAHCETCRDPAARAWRESLRRAFALPGNETDFECPHGVPWGFRKTPLPVERQPITLARAAHGAVGIARALTGTGGADKQMVESRTAICLTCEHAKVTAGVFRRCDLCGCSTFAKVRNAGEKCPAGKW